MKDMENEATLTHQRWLETEVNREDYWFHRIELTPNLITPGWSDPRKEKLPYFGLPDDMHGMRVLDIGCSEGFFSFEAERRGAAETIAIDSSPDLSQAVQYLPKRAKLKGCRISGKCV